MIVDLLSHFKLLYTTSLFYLTSHYQNQSKQQDKSVKSDLILLQHFNYQQLMNQNYDYEQDKQDKQSLKPPEEQKGPTIQQDYNYSKLSSQINELRYQFKGHQSQIKKSQKDIQSKITVSQLTETIALINSGIHSDPNVIKLLKTKQQFQDQGEEPDRLKFNSIAFSRKLNQMCESLTVLLNAIKKLQNKVTIVQSDLSIQLNQKFNQLQTQVEQARADQNKQSLQLHHKMQTISFELTDKLRQMDTQVNWKLTEFKSKIDDKINQEMVLIYMQDMEKKLDKNMREYQLKSNIDPERISRIEQEVNRTRIKAENGITQCNFVLASIRKEITEQLVHNNLFQSNKFKIQKRLQLFNYNFNDVYQRVKVCEAQESTMQQNITKLLRDAKTALSQLQRINTVLINLKIGQDFQRMLEEMNPAKVLQLQDSVDGVKGQQITIFKEIELAKRQIDKINAKSEIMGVLLPNKARDKLKKEELNQALNDFLVENQFAQKIASIDRQLTTYANSQEAVTLLARQVSRLQKQSDTHRLALEMRGLQEYLKRQIAFLHNKFAEKIPYNSLNDRVGSYAASNISSEDPFLLKQGVKDKSFSVKKMSTVQPLSSSRHIITNKISKIVQARTKKV